MSLSKLSLAANNLIIPGDGKIANLFYSVVTGFRYVTSDRRTGFLAVFFTKFYENLSAKFQLQIIFTSAVELNLFHFLTSCLYSVYVITLLEIAMVIYSAENISHVFIYLYIVIIQWAHKA